MKISLNWLRELVDLPGQVGIGWQDLATRLTLAGIEVEGVTHVGAGLSGAVVAEIRGKRRHPKADKLTLVDVFDGQQVTQVVCGAPNVPEPGEVGRSTRVVWARPGATLPSGACLGERDVRGIVSPGMLCAEDELGLSEDHGGILLLTPEDGIDIGADFAVSTGLPDTVLDLNVTPNRPDCMGHVGVAREVAALFAREGARLHLPEVDLSSYYGDTPAVSVEIRDPVGCPRYTARVLTGLRVGRSPLKARLRLQRLGVRALSNLVDATNLALLEWGQPLHAFDLAQLVGSRIVVRKAVSGETLTTLDGVVRSLVPGDVVIADGERGVALAGVMGGKSAEVTATTTAVLLEGAYFDPTTIRRTGRRLKMHTEASHRYERGVDPNQGLLRASARCAQLMLEMGGGTIAPALVDIYPQPIEPGRLALRAQRTRDIVGADIPAAEQVRLLTSLGLSVVSDGITGAEVLQVSVPTFRPDLTREIDLIEEVARLRGYDTVTPRLPRMRIADDERTQDARRLAKDGLLSDRARDLCAALGLSEVQNFSFVSPDRLRALGFPADDRRSQPITLQNPLREELSTMRTQLVPGLLEALRRQISHGIDDVRLFEVGEVFLKRPESDEYRALCIRNTALSGPLAEGVRVRAATCLTADKMPVEERARVAGVLAGHRDHFLNAGPGDSIDVFDISGLVEELARGLGLGGQAGVRVRVARPGEVPWLHPGVAAVVEDRQGRAIGEFGEIHPDLRQRLSIEVVAFAFELDLPQNLPEAPTFAPLPRFPAVTRDLSFFVDAPISAGDLLRDLRGAGETLLSDVQVMEDYREKGRVPEGKKGMLFGLTYRHPERTLTDEEVQKAHDGVVRHLRGQVSIDLR